MPFAATVETPLEGDNHLVELAVVGSADSIMTNDLRGLRSGQLVVGNDRTVAIVKFGEFWRTLACLA